MRIFVAWFYKKQGFDIRHNKNIANIQKIDLNFYNSKSLLQDIKVSCHSLTLMYMFKLEISKKLVTHVHARTHVCMYVSILTIWFINVAFNPFIPEYLKWTLPFLNLDMFTGAIRCFSLK